MLLIDPLELIDLLDTEAVYQRIVTGSFEQLWLVDQAPVQINTLEIADLLAK
jgi:hypothetical protein